LENSIFVKVKNGFKKVNIDSILFFESDCNYSKLTLVNGDIFLTCSTIGNIEKQLEFTNLLRVHKSYMINIQFIEEVLTEKCSNSCQLILKGNIKILVARRRKSFLFKLIAKI